jgi:adenosylcobinamide-phosphate synthase
VIQAGWLVLLVPAACALDRLVGDPRAWLHPVQVMGGAIGALRTMAETWAGDGPRRLRLAGFLLSVLVIAGSGLAGWAIERLALRCPPIGLPLLLVGLASSLAGRSLEQAVRGVLAALPDLQAARTRLAWIVGRDVEGLPESEILRAAAETAAENAVDGLFAPLFWMLAGMALWWIWSPGPGPLALAWAFKAVSTLDSMLGYRQGRLRWLGTAGARLDDVLTWLPCRLVALSLPLAAGRPLATAFLARNALRDGRPDPSPNAGVSQAAYAHAAGVRLGGLNRYGGGEKSKPLLAATCPGPDHGSVERILALTNRLEALWLLLAAGGVILVLLSDAG